MNPSPLVPMVALVCLGACLQRPAQTSAADAGLSAPLEPKKPDLHVTVTAETADAGTLPIPFSADVRPEIPPVEGLVLETNLALRNYRVRVFDEADRTMVSDDEAEDGDAGIRYRIHFPEPLATGHRYAVVVDAQTGPELLDSFGRSHDDVRLEFRIAGEKEKPRPPPRQRKRRR